MEPDWSEISADLKFGAYFDEAARAVARQFCLQWRSAWLTDLVLAPHQTDGRTVVMLNRINVVLALTTLSGTELGAIFAEQEGDNTRVVLHVLYVRPGYRRVGYGQLLLTRFDALIEQCGMKSVLAAVLNRASLRMLEKASELSALSYNVIVPAARSLDEGDVELSAGK